MSTIKNFGLVGIGADVQFGKGGARLIQTTGLFSAKNATGTALINLEVAAPTADTHATTRLFVNTGFAVTRTGAGLNADGTYTPNGSSNYINAATSLKSANNLLDSALYAVSTKLSTSLLSSGFASDGTLPAWSGTNYVTGTSSLLAAIKNLDTAVKSNNDAIAGLGNAINYVGVLTGGASTAAAYDLSTLPNGGKDIGDYYKVTTAGYFKDTAAATPYYANVGDGLVKNTTTTGWDKIDSTDSTVSGTANRLLVTGSADTGYVLDIDSQYVGQTSITTLGTVTSGTWNATAISPLKGGTGLTSYAVGDILFASATNTLARLPIGSGKQILRTNGAGTAPEFVTLVATDVNFTSGNYTATTVAAALDEVKTQVQNLSQDQILSPDTKTSVKVSDTNGVQFFDEVAATKTEIMRLTGTSTAATFAAQGSASNINIVLAPKGTGVISASNARLTGLANATVSSDAVPLVQAKASFTSYMVADVTEANTNVAIGAINGLVMRIIVYVSTAFASGSAITVGYSGSQSALVAASDIDQTQSGVYVIDNISAVNQNVIAYVTGTGAGVSKIIVEYLAF